MVMNKYSEKINAVQWDGTDQLLKELQYFFEGFVKLWKVDGTTPPSPNSLRLNNIQYQGDHWANVGDYVICDFMDDGTKKSRVISKDNFEKRFGKTKV